jgi:hypothetical protein
MGNEFHLCYIRPYTFGDTFSEEANWNKHVENIIKYT